MEICYVDCHPHGNEDLLDLDYVILAYTHLWWEGENLMRMYHVYILTNKTHTVLYIGMTNNIARRVCEHKHGLVKGFTERYRVHILIYIEDYLNVNEAIAREKQLKHWNREWKRKLISESNPEWRELVFT